MTTASLNRYANIEKSRKQRDNRLQAINSNSQPVHWNYTFRQRRLEIQDLLQDIYNISDHLNLSKEHSSSISFLFESLHVYIRDIQDENTQIQFSVLVDREFRRLLEKLRTFQLYMGSGTNEPFHYTSSETHRVLGTIRTIIFGLEKILVCNKDLTKYTWTVQEMV